MRVFLTGASGFLGSHLARLLLKAGAEMMALILPGHRPWRLGDAGDQVHWLEGDLMHVAEHRARLRQFRPDVCIHLAWYTEPGRYLQAPENIQAMVGSLRLLDALLWAGCRQFVMAGTCSEYDTAAGYLREETPTRPKTLYAATKLAVQLVASNVAENTGARLAWARLFYFYGPYEDRRRVVPALIRSLLLGQSFEATKGEQVRDYLHVADVASAFLALAEKRVSGIVNVASGVPVSIRQLMEMIGDVIGRTELIRFGVLPYREWEPMFVCGDNRRLVERAGWFRQYDLRGGIQDTVDWWKSQSDLC